VTGATLASAIFGTYASLVYFHDAGRHGRRPLVGQEVAPSSPGGADHGAGPFPDGVRCQFLFALLALIIGGVYSSPARSAPTTYAAPMPSDLLHRGDCIGGCFLAAGRRHAGGVAQGWHVLAPQASA
jgi:hypothetical protein